MLGLPAKLRFSDRSRDQLELIFQADDVNDDRGLEFEEFAEMCRRPRATVLRGQLRRRNELRKIALNAQHLSQDRGQLLAEGKALGDHRGPTSASDSSRSLHELSLGFSFNASATIGNSSGIGARIARGNAASFSSTAPVGSFARSSASTDLSNTHSGSFSTTLDGSSDFLSTMDVHGSSTVPGSPREIRSTSPVLSPTKSVRVRGMWDSEEEEEYAELGHTSGSLASKYEQRIETKWRRKDRVGGKMEPSRRLEPAAYGRSVHEKLVAFYRRYDPIKLSKEHILGEMDKFGLGGGKQEQDEEASVPNGVTRSGGLRALNAELARLYGVDLNTRSGGGGRLSRATNVTTTAMDMRTSTSSIGAFTAMNSTSASMGSSVNSTAEMHKELRQDDAARERNLHSSLQPLLAEIAQMQVSVLVEIDSTMRQAGQLQLRYAAINIDKTLTTYFMEMFDQDGSIHGGSGNGPIRQRLRDFISNLVKLVEQAGVAWKRVHHELVRENNRRRHTRKYEKWGKAKRSLRSKLGIGKRGGKENKALGFADAVKVKVSVSPDAIAMHTHLHIYSFASPLLNVFTSQQKRRSCLQIQVARQASNQSGTKEVEES